MFKELMVFKKIVGVSQIILSLLLIFGSIYLGLLRSTFLGAIDEFIKSIPSGVFRGNVPDFSIFGTGILIVSVLVGLIGLILLLQGIINLLGEKSNLMNPVPKPDFEKSRRPVRKEENNIYGENLGNEY